MEFKNVLTRITEKKILKYFENEVIVQENFLFMKSIL